MVVVDLCSLLAGAMAACSLADQGADCIKVEARDGTVIYPERDSNDSKTNEPLCLAPRTDSQ